MEYQACVSAETFGAIAWRRFRPGERYLSLPAHGSPVNPTNSGHGSGIQRLPERTPPLSEVLDDLARLLVVNLDEFVGEVTAFPFDDHRGELPAEVLPQSFIRRTVIMLKPSRQPVRVVDRPVFADDRVVSNLVWHLRTLPS